MAKGKVLRSVAIALLLTLALMVIKRGTQLLPASSPTDPVGTSAAATMAIDPPALTREMNQSFRVDISIDDVVDLYGWEFKLGWDATLLEALNITEGGFLKSQNDTLFVISINNTEGYLRAACTLISNIPGVNGTGTLATVEFNPKSYGESSLNLYDTKLVDSHEQPVSHTANDGHVSIQVANSPQNGGGKRSHQKLLK
jgi:hypothetical protein